MGNIEYNAHNWQTDETITAEKLNKMETGIARTVYIDETQSVIENAQQIISDVVAGNVVPIGITGDQIYPGSISTRFYIWDDDGVDKLILVHLLFDGSYGNKLVCRHWILSPNGQWQQPPDVEFTLTESN